MQNNSFHRSTKIGNVDTPGSNEAQRKHLGLGILGRYPVMSILAFATVGIATGVALSTWIPETAAEISQKRTTLQWIGLIGDLFIRALKCVVLPLVFVNMVTSVVEMMNIGKASSIGGRVVLFYFITTAVASVFGILAAVSFSPLFEKTDGVHSTLSPTVTLGCNNSEGSFLVVSADGSVACTSTFESESDIQFEITDVTEHFQTSKANGPKDDLSFSDSLYQGVFMKLVTSNIFGSFVQGNFAAVVFFGIVFGIALARELSVAQEEHREVELTIVSLLREINMILTRLIHWIIAITPFAVWSLIASTIGGQQNLTKNFANVGYLVIAIIAGMTCQFLVVYVLGFGMVIKSNPFGYLKHILPAQVMAFACSSSAATLPVTMDCVQDTGRVPESIWKFVLPLGATINMDGTAINIPCACVWMALLNGITPNAGQYVLLAILATVGSAGAAPVPNSGLVLILTTYNTVFNAMGTPAGFSFVVAIDWFVGRLNTVINVTSDAVICGSIAATTNSEQDFPVKDGMLRDAGRIAGSGVEHGGDGAIVQGNDVMSVQEHVA